MSNEFDPAEFDAPIAPADHTVLLKAIRDAAYSGVRDGNENLAQTVRLVSQEVRNLQTAEAGLGRADAALKRAQASLFWDHAKYALVYGASIGMILAGAGAGYSMLKAPKVTTEYIGCTSWDARQGNCRGEWTPLSVKRP